MTIERTEEPIPRVKDHTSAVLPEEQDDEDSGAASDSDDGPSIDAASVADAQCTLVDYLCRLIAEEWLRNYGSNDQSKGDCCQISVPS